MPTVRVSSPVTVPVILVSSTDGSGLTGLTYSDVTVFVHRPDGVKEVKALTAGQFVEVDATYMPGVYDLGVEMTDTYPAGILKYSVKSTNSDMYLGTVDVVDYTLGNVLNEVTFVKEFVAGRWKLDPAGNTFTVFDSNNIPLRTYDTRNAAGTPSTVGVHERIPQP